MPFIALITLSAGESSVGAGRLTARGEAGKPGALGLLLELSPGAAGDLGTRT